MSRETIVFRRRVGASGAGGLCAGLCAALLLPTASCATVNHLAAPDGAARMFARDASVGVEATMTLNAWALEPMWIHDRYTVVHVLITNQTTQPIRVLPGDFALDDERGFAYSLLDTGSYLQREGDPPGYNREVGPAAGRREPFNVGWDVSAMATHALPWGVVEPGAQIRGFVYFEDVRDRAEQPSLTWYAHNTQGTLLTKLRFELAVYHSRVR